MPNGTTEGYERKTLAHVWLHNAIFLVLLLALVGLLGTLSNRYTFSMDWTATGRHTLQSVSMQLLGRLPGEVRVTVFTKDLDAVRRPTTAFLKRYHRAKSDLTVEFVNPETAPNRVRTLGVRVEGEIVIAYQGRTEHLTVLTEQTMANALERLARTGDRLVVFLQDHGEPTPEGTLGLFAQALHSKGVQTASMDLEAMYTHEDSVGLLIVGGAQGDWSAGDIAILQAYLRLGGNLLWLAEPGSLHGLDVLAQTLGLEISSVVLEDTDAQRFGPSFVLGAHYEPHPVTQAFDKPTLFHAAGAVLMHAPGTDWRAVPLVESGEESRVSTPPKVGFLPLGVALTRTSATATPLHREQRVVVFGGGDFLSDAFLGNGGNLDLGLSVVNWLLYDDDLIAIPVHVALDASLSFSRPLLWLMNAVFLIALPLTCFGVGALVWLRRRRLSR